MATKLNLVIDQGATYSNTSIIAYDSSNNVMNLTDSSITAKIRKHYTSTNATSFTASGNSSGVITLSLTANSTANLTAGRYVYDVVATSNTGTVTRVKEGIVTVTPRATY